MKLLFFRDDVSAMKIECIVEAVVAEGCQQAY